MDKINIVVLDASTLGSDIDFKVFESFGKVEVYDRTDERQIRFRIMDADVIIANKIKLNSKTLAGAKRLKLICVTATGYDNVDLSYCRMCGIAVSNVRGYSTESVAQITASMALALVNHINIYDRYVKDYRYTKSGVENHLEPVFHEMSSLTWGIVGLGEIGERVANIAESFGCRVLAFKRRPDPIFECVPLDELCRRADIISIHLPLTPQTRNIVNDEMISYMKPSAVVINAARGAVTDETALANAISEGRLGGLGIDVYSEEPMRATSPYVQIMDKPNVIFTPHMAWGAYEARVRCMNEIVMNIEAFLRGRRRNRVDI